MKCSRFNVLTQIDDGLIIYNTLSEGVLQLDPQYADQYIDFANQRITTLEKELQDNLIKGNMLVEDNLDEIGYLKVKNSIGRFSNQSFAITIAPTMKCNFRCPYCYEKGHNYTSMSKEVVEEVKEYFRQLQEQTKYLMVAWYGGEPLLAFDTIKELTEEAIKIFGNQYQADMVTNGYLLSKEMISQFEDLKIRRIQITIDGPPDIHNQMRKLPSGEDTFFVILNNMKSALEIYPELQITVRVNVDKSNITRVDEILAYISKYELKDKIGIYLAPIDNINNTCNPSQCFSSFEFAREQIKFARRNMENGYNFINIPQANLCMCGAVSSNSLVIDASGDLYKCWDDVGHKEHSIGNLKAGIVNKQNYIKWLSYDIFTDAECTECEFLPACMGGCANHRLKNKGKRCNAIKANVHDLIKLLYTLKLRRNQNGMAV